MLLWQAVNSELYTTYRCFWGRFWPDNLWASAYISSVTECKWLLENLTLLDVPRKKRMLYVGQWVISRQWKWGLQITLMKSTPITQTDVDRTFQSKFHFLAPELIYRHGHKVWCTNHTLTNKSGEKCSWKWFFSKSNQSTTCWKRVWSEHFVA